MHLPRNRDNGPYQTGPHCDFTGSGPILPKNAKYSVHGFGKKLFANDSTHELELFAKANIGEGWGRSMMIMLMIMTVVIQTRLLRRRHKGTA